MESDGIGIPNLPNQVYLNCTKKGIVYNVMVAGSNGTGKTTFINYLLRQNVLPKNPFDQGESLEFELNNEKGLYIGAIKEFIKLDKSKEKLSEDWQADTLVNFQFSSLEIDEKRFFVDFNIVEVDNIGELVDNTGVWEVLRKFLTSKFDRQYELEENNLRNQIYDQRIHVCVYFFEPIGERIRPVDLKTMKEISKFCNIIPVIPKGDGYLENEKNMIRFQTRKILMENKIINNNVLSEHVFPLFIISEGISEKKALEKREYSWGVVGPNDIINSDTPLLKNILIRTGLLSLIKATDRLYEEYRMNLLARSIINDINADEATKEIARKFLAEFAS